MLVYIVWKPNSGLVEGAFSSMKKAKQAVVNYKKYTEVSYTKRFYIIVREIDKAAKNA